jgi:hypothetical protein
LEDRPAGFDGVMLALVAHEDDALNSLFSRFVEEAVDLPGGKEARFVDDPDLFRERSRRGAFKQAPYGSGAPFEPGPGQPDDGGRLRSARPAGLARSLGAIGGFAAVAIWPMSPSTSASSSDGTNASDSVMFREVATTE